VEDGRVSDDDRGARYFVASERIQTLYFEKLYSSSPLSSDGSNSVPLANTFALEITYFGEYARTQF